MKRYVIGERPSKFRVFFGQKVHPVYWFSFVAITATMAAYVVNSVYAPLYVVSAEPARTVTEQEPAIEPKPLTTTAKLLFMGDTMLDRSIGEQILRDVDPFMYVRGQLAEADLRIANIETTIADPATASQASKTYTFNAPVESLHALEQANIDVSVLANNHTSDFGSNATANMLSLFSQAGLKTVGAGNTVDEAFAPLLVPVHTQLADGQSSQLTVGFVATNDIENQHTKVRDDHSGSAYFDEARIGRSITTARERGADLVIVLVHWGTEYTHIPSARQQTWGRLFIDQGADLVVGGHPHVTQPTEMYRGKQIIYSLGNFIFDGMEGDAREGNMAHISAELTTSPDGSRSARFHEASLIPYSIDSSGFPRP